MSGPADAFGAVRSAYRRHERKVIGTLLLGGVAGLVLLGFAPTRVQLLDRAETALISWDNRWDARVAHGEALVKARRYEEAATYLAALDSVFPARVVKHRRDMERTRVLTALGEAYFALGKKRATLDTYRILVAFDPRNWQSHYKLATTALELNEPDEAVLHLREVLKIHPNHLPSVRALIARQVWESNSAGVVATYEAYLKAYQLWPVRLQVGESVAELDVPADGKFHDIEVLIPFPAGQLDTLRLNPGGLYAEISSVVLLGPVVIGRVGRDSARVQPAGTALWHIAERLQVEPDKANSGEARIVLPALPNGLERMRVTMRLPKPVDAALWASVEQAYRNRLLLAALQSARERSFILSSIEAANLIPIRE